MQKNITENLKNIIFFNFPGFKLESKKLEVKNWLFHHTKLILVGGWMEINLV
jgi:hypothetical protein